MNKAVKEFMAANGRKGGASKSPKKIEALKNNLAKANERKAEIFKAAKKDFKADGLE